ncbi:hypothetical protein DB771_29205 [Burkholderia sp. AU29985]|nr:hypothetical protein XM57_18910 [Burkholderia cepacia]AYZ96770.1 hypothetical protein EGY28_16815 [Burkholderia dolosa]PRE43739.1 hypothetical protein C6P87_24505 [Burkholderia sp. AU12872]PUA73336.1 hypothetical protein DB771_29205 [Burkholderia sp. AU29985]
MQRLLVVWASAKTALYARSVGAYSGLMREAYFEHHVETGVREGTRFLQLQRRSVCDAFLRIFRDASPTLMTFRADF